MSPRTLALLIDSISEHWSVHRWTERFRRVLPNRPIVAFPGEGINPTEVGYAAVWRPSAGSLARLPNLRVIFNLGAGVDALMADVTLPRLPIVRAVSLDLAYRMSEYVLLHVLLYHRQQNELDRAQARREWISPPQWAAKSIRVGIMGLGALGIDAARKLRTVGFDVAGWSGSNKNMEGITCYTGPHELKAFLARTDVLVALLPLTAQTRGILNYKLFSELARDGVLGGPVLINAGRGGLQDENDVLAALNDGVLIGATLDVFENEPLPATSPFWTHPKVRITPHNAADCDPDVLAKDVADQILAFERGEPLRHTVDAASGY